MPRYPNPDDQRRNRVPPAFTWTELPAEGRAGKPPTLPGWRVWQPATKKWWSELWATPQSTQWDQSGRTLWVLACIYDDVIAGRKDSTAASAEMRQVEDRHGLNPKAMLQLRWRVGGAEPTAEANPTRRPKSRRSGTLRVVGDSA